MKTLTFYKEDNKWYIDLPEYLEADIDDGNGGYTQGSREDLELILGADDLLEELSGGKDKVSMLVATSSQEIRNLEDIPAYRTHNWEFLILANYIKTSFGKYYTAYNARYIWLHPVVEFIFGLYPEYIYYKIIKHEDNQR